MDEDGGSSQLHIRTDFSYNRLSFPFLQIGNLVGFLTVVRDKKVYKGEKLKIFREN